MARGGKRQGAGRAKGTPYRKTREVQERVAAVPRRRADCVVSADPRSPKADSYRSWYWTARWRRISRSQLAAHPLCAMCHARGHVVPATVCDHVEPHRGDEARFWGGPFQSLCKADHDGLKQRQERKGHVVGSDRSGRPVDPAHPWNRPR